MGEEKYFQMEKPPAHEAQMDGIPVRERVGKANKGKNETGSSMRKG
jgi:hypothetical protein